MRMEASEWLADFVGDRWVKTADVRKAALSDGLSWRTVERVRQAEDYRRAKQPGVAHGQWWIARQDCQVPTPPPGGVGDLADLQDSNPANAARGRDSQLAFLDDNPAKDANDANTAGDENDEISAEWSEEDSTKLDQYRRERDRRLGEDDDDD
jgi:hypothetical protein